MNIDIEKVADIIRSAAEIEILPRFRALSPSDIEEKNPGDLVTIADRRAEAYLSQHLLEIIPSALIVGEEGHQVQPEALKGIADADWAWIIDPLDGTYNFAHGTDKFAVIVALCRNGETCAGWIYDPIRGHMAVAEKGAGCQIDDVTVETVGSKAIDEMQGSLGRKLADRVRRDAALSNEPSPKNFLRYRCVGLEYMDLVRGKLDFARYGGKLMPWDHAAGVLMHFEAGGYSRFGPSERRYSPGDGVLDDYLLVAPEQATWRALSRLIG